MITQQIVYSEDKNTTKNEIIAEDSKKKRNKIESSIKRGRGRPKGSKNKNKEDVELSSYQLIIQSILRRVLKLIGSTIPIAYVVLDGAFGHNKALRMVRQCNLHIISKLQCNSAFYFPYKGKYCGRGAYRKH